MKFKRIIVFFFFLSFTIYSLCPLFMQGNCGFSLPSSVSIAKSSQYHQIETFSPQLDWSLNRGILGLQASPLESDSTQHCRSTTGCETGDANTPPHNGSNAENCCIIGLELLNPSHPDHLNPLFITALSLVAVIPFPAQAPLLSEPTFRHVRPITYHYNYYPAHQISLRGPPLFLS